MFFPGFLGMLLNPFFFARKGLLGHLEDLSGSLYGEILDIGCGIKPYRSLFKSTGYFGLELDTEENREKKAADFFYDGHRFPFESHAFDAVVAFQVFEHVFNPQEFLLETWRILHPGGLLLMTLPFLWDEHEQPFDFARYSSFGIRSLLEQNGFEIIVQRKSVDDMRVIFQLTNIYIYKITRTKSAVLNVMVTLLFMAPLNILGQLLSLVLPRNPDLYLDNIVLAKKVNSVRPHGKCASGHT